MLALYEAVLDELPISAGTRVLDVACGPGLFLRLAAQRGATVSGVDPEAPLIAIARERMPDAELVIGEMESMPFADRAFDVVTGFNAFQFATDPARALREAARVGVAGCPIVIAAWSRPEHCEAAAYLKAVGGADAFALSQPHSDGGVRGRGRARRRRAAQCRLRLGLPGRGGRTARAVLDRVGRRGDRRRRRAAGDHSRPGVDRAVPGDRR